jgi:hypothetical protein
VFNVGFDWVCRLHVPITPQNEPVSTLNWVFD